MTIFCCDAPFVFPKSNDRAGQPWVKPGHEGEWKLRLLRSVSGCYTESGLPENLTISTRRA
jgi:hypothetical protein